MVIENFTSDWIYANLTTNRYHNTKHVLDKPEREFPINPQEMATAQALSLMLANYRYNRASMFLTDNPSMITDATHSNLYALMSDSSINNRMLDLMQNDYPVIINVKMPKVNPDNPSSPLLGGMYFELNRSNILYDQEATNAFAVVLNPNNEYEASPILDNWPSSDFEGALDNYHIATIYPTIDYYTDTIGLKPLHKPVNPEVDMTRVINYIDPRLLSNMPMYERMAWLTSNNVENKENHISRTLNRNMHFLTLEDVGNETTANGEHVYGHRIRVNDTQAQYAPEDPRFNKSRNMLWHDLTEYNGNNEFMQNMRDRYIWLLNNTDGPQYGMHQTQSDDYSY